MKTSQKEIIKRELEMNGVVDNASAFNGLYGRNILRLGAIVHELRNEGMGIETNYKNERGFRNCIYSIKK